MTCSTSDVAVCCSSEFGQLPRALLLRLEQPHVLDGDHRLVGEGLDQLDLLVGKWPHRFRGRTNTPMVAPARKSGTPTACEYRQGLLPLAGVIGIGQHVRNLNGLPCSDRPADHRPRPAGDVLIRRIGVTSGENP